MNYTTCVLCGETYLNAYMQGDLCQRCREMEEEEEEERSGPSMDEFIVTFGVQYREEPHPTLGWMPDLPDHWCVIRAEDETQARDIAVKHFGRAWAFIYTKAEWELRRSGNRRYFTAGPIRLEDLLARAGDNDTQGERTVD